MCLSQSVSFAASGFLIAGGAFATAKAWKINKRYVAVALMPLLAGAQQFTEGSVWWGVNNGDPVAVLWGALSFIFFTWLIWPVWIPLSVYVLEPDDSSRKRMFLIITLLGAGFGLLLYVPHVIYPEWVSVRVNSGSLAYEGTMFLDYMLPREATYAIYVSLIIIPPLMSRYLHFRLFAGTIVIVLMLDVLLFRYAYISFFCFLAGLATLHLIYIILRNKCARECPVLFS